MSAHLALHFVVGGGCVRMAARQAHREGGGNIRRVPSSDLRVRRVSSCGPIANRYM